MWTFNICRIAVKDKIISLILERLSGIFQAGHVIGQPPSHVFDVELLPPEELLGPDLVPSVVFWVWCGPRWFEFHHYINVLSVLKVRIIYL